MTTGVSLSAVGHQFGGKARKERVIGIVHAGWRLRLIRIDGSSIKELFAHGNWERLIGLIRQT